jgi:hypothetical protein
MGAAVRAGFRGLFEFERGNGWGGTTVRERAAAGEVDWEIDGDLGGCRSPPKRFKNLHDIDITSAPIDWAGSLKNPNNKKFNRTESKCWSLDFAGASGET